MKPVQCTPSSAPAKHIFFRTEYCGDEYEYNYEYEATDYYYDDNDYYYN